MPAAGCDAQYNHLIEERGRLSKEMASLDAIDRLSGINEFIDRSDYIDHRTAAKILQE